MAAIRGFAADRPALAEGLGVAVAAVLIAFITRPVFDLAPREWIEAAWQGALHIELRQDRHFGGETGIYFTYGPLGWMRIPTYWTGLSGAIAVLCVFAELVLLAAVLLLILRRRLAWLWAIAATFAVLSMQLAALYHPPLPMAALAASLYLIYDPRPELQRLLAGAGGIAAGYAALGRINSGVMVFAVIACALAFTGERRRSLAILVAGSVLTFLAGWLLMENSLADLPSYARGVSSLISGYSDGMSYDDPDVGWRYPAAALLVGVGVAGAIVGERRDGRRARAALICIWLIFSYMVFKQGFVRNDFHTLFFVQAMAVGLVAMPWPRRWYGPAIALSVLLCLAIYIPMTGRSLSAAFNYLDRIKSSGHALVLIADSSERAAETDRGYADILRRRSVPEGIRARLRASSSTVWPNDLTVSMAVGGQLRALPTLQAYVALTPELERHNVAAIEDERSAPERILTISEPVFEGRLPAFVAPKSTLAVLCRYRLEQPIEGDYAMLRRGRNRCATPQRTIKTVRAGWGESVAVPAPSTPDSLVLARVQGAKVGGLERLRAQLFRADMRSIEIDGPIPNSPATSYRVMPSNAASGMLVRSGSRADLPAKFRFAPQTQTIRLTREHAPGGRPLRIEFAEQRLR